MMEANCKMLSAALIALHSHPGEMRQIHSVNQHSLGSILLSGKHACMGADLKLIPLPFASCLVCKWFIA
jgi:hypothetical protein